MLISPPFLPQHPASGPDDPWLAQAMNSGGFGHGAFPLGTDLTWHGGVHLTAPRQGVGHLPVCAIADGTVAYVRQPTLRPGNQTAIALHSLGYRGWTDDGCVIIKHATEIGENLAVTYFSINLHLKRIAPHIKHGQKIWRKQEVGEAGSIDGTEGLIHFEIVCDDANLAALVGRKSGQLFNSQDGRTNVVFGDAHVRLPDGSPFYETMPLPPASIGFWSETTPMPTPTYVSSEALIVSVALSRKDAHYVTSTVDGPVIGSAPALSDTSLYKASVALATNNSAIGRDMYELLRFGRILEPLGASNDALPNWQQVAYPGGQGWVDLHASGVHAFSDADFPDECGWRLIDDDSGNDSRCGSADLLNLIMQNNGRVTPTRKAQALGRLTDATVQMRLARSICKFPTEWKKSAVAARWQWLTTQTPPGAGPMAGPYLQQSDFSKFQKHVEALCFWDTASLGIPSTHWHFHPREFIRVFRQCGWLSKDEMFQLFPQTAMRNAGSSGWVSESVAVLPSSVHSYCNDLNKACRRYGIVTPLRMAAFYANTMVETQWFARLEERVSTAHPPRYYPWNGRGFMQLTWPDNYIKYWRFKGKTVADHLAQDLHHAAALANAQGMNTSLSDATLHVPTAMQQWRDDIGSGKHVAQSADSAGAYWAWSHSSQYADVEPANQRSSKPAPGNGTHTYYTSHGMGNVAATVNVGHPSTHYARVNGIVARFQAYNTCEVVLLDTPVFPGSNNPNEPQGYKPRHS